MSDEQDESQSQADEDGLTANEINDFTLRLKYGDPGAAYAHIEVVDEIIGLRHRAVPLLPLVLELYKAGKIKLVSSTLLRFYEATGCKDFLAIVRCPEHWGSLSMYDKCNLMRYGVVEIEKELVQELWQHWQDGTADWRIDAVQVLAAKGGKESLDLLRGIVFKLSAALPEQKAKAIFGQRDRIPPDVLEELEDNVDKDGQVAPEILMKHWSVLAQSLIPQARADANARFLDEVFIAVNVLRSRLGIEN